MIHVTTAHKHYGLPVIDLKKKKKRKKQLFLFLAVFENY